MQSVVNVGENAGMAEGITPGGAALTGPTGYASRRPDKAMYPVALRLPGLQDMLPVGRIRRLRRHPAS
ncbi:TPA: hypothetical protein U2I18_004037 [Citrobacter koseri]|nr:hypothetical protein [Citrobacter koseri]